MATYLLKNVTLLDGVSFSPRSDMSLLIRDGIIAAIGHDLESYDAEGIPLDGKFVMPGLIDAHVHLMFSGKPAGGNTNKTPKRNTEAKFAKMLSKWPGSALLKKSMRQSIVTSLNAGVTTMRCVGDMNYYDVDLRNDIRAGKLQGPRLLVSGPVLTPTGGHGAMFGHPVDSPMDARKYTRTNIAAQVDLIKIMSTGGVGDAKKIGDAGRLTMSADEITEACREAHKAGLMVATHCQSTEGMRLALRCGVDTIEHGGAMDDEIVELFLKNPNSLRGYSSMIPTLSPAMAYAKLDPAISHAKSVAIENSRLVVDGMIHGIHRAMGSGISLGIGTDATMSFVTHYNTWRELDFLIRYACLRPDQVLALATRENARILGIDDITGTLEVGKAADLLVLNDNPLTNIRTLQEPVMVMAGETFLRTPAVKRFPEVEAAWETI